MLYCTYIYIHIRILMVLVWVGSISPLFTLVQIFAWQACYLAQACTHVYVCMRTRPVALRVPLVVWAEPDPVFRCLHMAGCAEYYNLSVAFIAYRAVDEWMKCDIIIEEWDKEGCGWVMCSQEGCKCEWVAAVHVSIWCASGRHRITRMPVLVSILSVWVVFAMHVQLPKFEIERLGNNFCRSIDYQKYFAGRL